MSVIDTLITDRLATDVRLVQDLNSKGIENMTDDELAEWYTELKGAYNYTDLNRVSSAVQYVATQLTDAGYEYPTLVIKTDWVMTDKPTPEQLAAYLQSVKDIREVIDLAEGTPPAPANMNALTFEQANDIERILVAVEESVQLILYGFIYADEMYSAEAWE